MKRIFFFSLCIIVILAICSCTRPSETATVYTLAPFEKPYTKDFTICGYKTTSKGKALTKGQTSALKKIIGKKSNYRFMESSLKTPFAPHIAFEFNENNKQKKHCWLGSTVKNGKCTLQIHYYLKAIIIVAKNYLYWV